MNIQSEIKSLKPGEKIEIDHTGIVKKVWRDNTGKKHTIKLNDVIFNEADIKLNTPPWVNSFSSGIKSFSDFGKKVKKEYDNDQCNMALAILKMAEEKAKAGKYIDQNSIKFNTLEFNGIKAFFAEKTGKLQYVIINEKTYYFREQDILLKEFMGICENCSGIFPQNKLSLYKLGFSGNKHLCKSCADQNPDAHEITIK